MKKMTKAFKEIQDYRDLINKGKNRVLASDLSSCVYWSKLEGTDHYVARGYGGRAKKHAFYYKYRTMEEMKKKIKDFMEGRRERANLKRTKQERALFVGDVLRCSWGYDQTNIDYYMVTKLIGKTMVEIVEIGQEKKETLYMQGECIPDKTNIIGKPMRKKANGNSVRIESYATAYKEEPEIIAGTEIYSSSHWTNYA